MRGNKLKIPKEAVTDEWGNPRDFQEGEQIENPEGWIRSRDHR